MHFHKLNKLMSKQTNDHKKKEAAEEMDGPLR